MNINIEQPFIGGFEELFPQRREIEICIRQEKESDFEFWVRGREMGMVGSRCGGSLEEGEVILFI